MSFHSHNIIQTLFLTISSLAFAVISVYQEVHTGEPALRGLVHAGIGGLFVFLIHTKPRSPIAPLFGAFGMAIGCQAAWLSNMTALASICAVGAIEALRLADEVPAIGAYIALALTRLIPTSCDVTERMTFVFHSAFASSVADTTGMGQAMVSATLALRAHDSPVALLLAFAFVRACWSAWRPTSRDDDEPTIITLHISGSTPYVASAALYTAALVADAWLCCALDTFRTSTRVLHATAVGASLLYLIPTACDAYAWLRWPLTMFPLVDALLCAYRLAVDSASIALYPRALGALLVAVGLHTTPLRIESSAETVPRSARARLINRTALGLYGIVHVAQALQTTLVENALAMVFHYIIIILSLAWIGIEDMDWLSLRYARAFLALESLTSVCMASLVRDERLWMALSAASAALLGWRVHAERCHAHMRYGSSLLSVCTAVTVPNGPANDEVL